MNFFVMKLNRYRKRLVYIRILFGNLLIVCRFFDVFHKYNGRQNGCLKLKRPKQLQEVLDVARYLLAEPNEILCEKHQKLEQLKTVLEMSAFYLAFIW